MSNNFKLVQDTVKSYYDLSNDAIGAIFNYFNPLMGTGNYNDISNNIKLVHWPLMGGLLRLVQR